MNIKAIAVIAVVVGMPDLKVGPTHSTYVGPTFRSGGVLAAQAGQTRRVTNLALLITYPSFYHLRPITVVGQITRLPNRNLQLEAGGRQMHLVHDGGAPDGPAEVRGEFWDLGRMKVDDPRLVSYDVQRLFGIDPDGPWPRSGQVTAIVATAVTAADVPQSASIRSLVLFPERYLDTTVTLVGQFAGRNLIGDLPDAPARSPYDFVLRSGDAAIWISNARPRGRDFELSLDTRIDTGRWVEVSGRLQTVRGLPVIDAPGQQIVLRPAPTEKPLPEPIVVSKAPPPEVVFSMPTENDYDVSWSTPVRIQFSRELDQSTLKGRVRVRYLSEETRALGEPDDPVARFTVQYTRATNVLEVRLTENLVRYRTIKIELLEGILATDKQPLAPWTLTFKTGSH